MLRVLVLLLKRGLLLISVSVLRVCGLHLEVIVTMVVVLGFALILLGWRCTLLRGILLLILLTVILTLRGVNTAISTSVIAGGRLRISLRLVAAASVLILISELHWRVLHAISIHILIVESLLSWLTLQIRGVIVIASLHRTVHHVGVVGVGADYGSLLLMALVRARWHIGVACCGTWWWLLLLMVLMIIRLARAHMLLLLIVLGVLTHARRLIFEPLELLQ